MWELPPPLDPATAEDIPHQLQLLAAHRSRYWQPLHKFSFELLQVFELVLEIPAVEFVKLLLAVYHVLLGELVHVKL